jgi:hypothetical protein
MRQYLSCYLRIMKTVRIRNYTIENQPSVCVTASRDPRKLLNILKLNMDQDKFLSFVCVWLRQTLYTQVPGFTHSTHCHMHIDLLVASVIFVNCKISFTFLSLLIHVYVAWIFLWASIYSKCSVILGKIIRLNFLQRWISLEKREKKNY